MRHATTGETVLIIRGKNHYYPADTKCSPECLNAKLPYPPSTAQVLAMQHGSLIGWDTPGADPATWERTATADGT